MKIQDIYLDPRALSYAVASQIHLGSLRNDMYSENVGVINYHDLHLMDVLLQKEYDDFIKTTASFINKSVSFDRSCDVESFFARIDQAYEHVEGLKSSLGDPLLDALRMHHWKSFLLLAPFVIGSRGLQGDTFFDSAQQGKLVSVAAGLTLECSNDEVIRIQKAANNIIHQAA